MRPNIRILVFAAVFATVVGYPVYTFVEASATGGVSRAGDHLDVDLKAMTNFDMDQRAATTVDVPKRWRALEGQRVALTGQVAPGNSAVSPAAGEDFDLVYSRADCCFSGAPLVQHFVRARVPAGTVRADTPNFVRVTGTLHVRVEHEGGRVTRVFSVDVERVDPL